VFVSVELVDDVMTRGEVKVKAAAVWFLPGTRHLAAFTNFSHGLDSSALRYHLVSQDGDEKCCGRCS
jgi:hypothetical protein